MDELEDPAQRELGYCQELDDPQEREDAERRAEDWPPVRGQDY